MTKKRRGNGEGSITQRSDGRWMARITTGHKPGGARIVRTVYGKTKRDVQEKLMALQHQKATGTLTDASKMTVAEWLNHWHEHVSRPAVRATTHLSYGGIIAKHLISALGRLKLTALMPAHVQSLYSAMEANGYSGRMRQLTHAVLRRALKIAMRQGMVSRNVCDAVEPPRVQKREMVTLTPEQATAFLKAAAGDEASGQKESPLHALFVLALTTGLRQGELFCLHWGDIDLDNATLSVQRTLIEVQGKLSFGPPKSTKSRRTINLPGVAVDALWNHKAKMLTAGQGANPLVFCDSRGGLLRKSNFMRNDFKPLLVTAGVPNVRFHDLRHTSATLMLAEGVPAKLVQERLGHSQISLTLDTYSHVLPEMDRRAAETFDRVFGKLA
ncbi:MAG: site-specific integrase [Planctomycetaceae bacterium]|nr:site-specific integrase [Planctomycetaceae bacterium]